MRLYIVVALMAHSAFAAEVSLRADVWYPMNGDPNASHPGFMIEIAKESLAMGGHSINYQNMPWERAVAEVRAGKFDCVVGAYKDDTPDFVFPDEEMGKDVQAFFVKKGSSWKFDGNFEALKSISIGVIGGYSYSDEFANYLDSANAPAMVQVISGDNALEQNLKKIVAGRIVATVESIYVADTKLKDMKLQGQIEQAGLLGDPIPMYVACSPARASSKEYARLLSEGVKKLRANGRLRAILDYYGLKDWR